MAEGRTGTVSILFTDIVGSTDLLAELGDDGAEAMRRRHFDVLREAVASTGGDEVKTTGDGLMVAYPSASDAVAGAVGMQRAVARENRRIEARPLGLRVGLSIGDATCEDGDYYGAPVVEAARLCGAAGAGQILTTEITRALAGTRGGHRYASFGAIDLKGLPEAVPACQVEWEVAASAEIPLPPALVAGSEFRFAGRADEQDVLRRAWKEAVAGDRQVVLVAGEPGIGKTRLATELARGVHDDGAVVLYGRCDEELGAAYHPFVEALRHLVRNADEDDLRGHVERHGGELTLLVPELPERVPDAPEPIRADPETERLRLLEAVSGLLGRMSGAAPVLLVLDDIHWADKPTLLLLRHLVRTAEPMALLVVGTYRDTDLTRTHPLAAMLADFRREPGVERIALRGLDEDGVVAFLEAASNHPLEEDGRALARALQDETEGNPFFVGEIVRHLVETGALYRQDGRWTSDLTVEQLGIPEGVREVIGRRVSRLSDDANTVLTAASVTGREFDLGITARVGGLDEDDALTGLEEAIAANLVHEVAGSPDRYTFTHALVQSTLYDELRASRRVRLHRRAADAIEELHAGDIDRHIVELAHHACEGAVGENIARAVAYARRAGDLALVQAGPEEAARHFRVVLETQEHADTRDPRLEAELSLALALALARAAEAGHREAYLTAAERAREVGDPELLAQAAVGYGGVAAAWDEGVVQRGVALLEEALAALGDEPSPLRAVALSRLASWGIFSLEWAEREALIRDALVMARATCDPPTLALVLTNGLLALDGPDDLAAEMALADELISVGDELRDPFLSYYGRQWRCNFLTILGPEEAFEVEFEIMAELVERTRVFGWSLVSTQARLAVERGRFAEAEQLNEEALAEGTGLADMAATAVYHATIATADLLRGRLDELTAKYEAMVQDPEQAPLRLTWTAALAAAYAESGRAEDARATLAPLAANGFALPHNRAWFSAIALTALAVARLGDREWAAQLTGLLVPHSGRQTANLQVYLGAVDYWLGELAVVTGDDENAVAYFKAAHRQYEERGARPWTAFMAPSYAAALRRRAQPGDEARAAALAEEALEIAEELGVASTEARVDGLPAT